MEMVLKVAQHSAHHGDWTYFSGFDRVEKEDNWYLYLDTPEVIDENSGIGQSATYKVTCETPGHVPYGALASAFEQFVSQAELGDLCEGRIRRLHVVRIRLMARTEEEGYRCVGQLLCSTAAFILNGTGANIDRLV